MEELLFKIKNSLEKFDFIRRYEELSNRFSSERTPSNERLKYVDRDEVMEILFGFGHTSQFHKKEKIFKIKEEQISTFTFGFHIISWDGMADLGSQRKRRIAAWRTFGYLFKEAY